MHLHHDEWKEGWGSEQGESGNSIRLHSTWGKYHNTAFPSLIGGASELLRMKLLSGLRKESTTTGLVASTVPSLPRAPLCSPQQKPCSSLTGAANPCREQGKLRHTGSSICTKGGQPRGFSYSPRTRQNPFLSHPIPSPKHGDLHIHIPTRIPAQACKAGMLSTLFITTHSKTSQVNEGQTVF